MTNIYNKITKNIDINQSIFKIKFKTLKSVEKTFLKYEAKNR